MLSRKKPAAASSFLGAAVLVGSLLVAVPANAARAPLPALSPLRTLASSAAFVPPGAVATGPLAAGRAVHFVVTLRPRHQSGLDRLLQNVDNRSSPYFHHFFRTDQFAARFGATPSAISAVRSVLTRQGATLESVGRNRLAVFATASAATLDRSFGVELTTYRLLDGRKGFANARAPRIPASIAPYVQAVLGLSTLSRWHDHVVAPRPGLMKSHRRARSAGAPGRSYALPRTTTPVGPKPCAAASAKATAYGGYTADQVAGYYAMKGLYGLGDSGQGVRIAMFELEDNSTADIAEFEACYGISTKVNYVPVAGGATWSTPGAEATLDIEIAMSYAPKATVDVYQAPNTATGVYDEYATIVQTNVDKVISTSWGICEQTAGGVEAEQTLFKEAAAQGQSIFAAAGDSGSTDCYRLDVSNPLALAVDDPASQPYVVGVGGTTLTAEGETVWNGSSTSSGAGGGGISELWCMPTYQKMTGIPGLISGFSRANTSCTGSGYMREVPDVAGEADPYTGPMIYYSGADTGIVGWQPIGGTSAASPLWAALAALIDASPFCASGTAGYGSGPVGIQAAGLYKMAAGEADYIYKSKIHGLHDITVGSNYYSPAGGGQALYPATPGYDEATGLGTPLLSGLVAQSSGVSYSNFYPGLAALMCQEYARSNRTTALDSISPSGTRVNQRKTVTLTGKGLLTLAGAVRVHIGKSWLTATCKTDQSCTVTLPALPKGTYPVQVSVEDSAPTTVTTHDRFTYADPPTTRMLAPGGGLSLRKTIKVSFAGHDALGPVSHYSVAYKVAGPRGGFSAWRYRSGWRETDKTSLRFKTTSGHTYCFGVRATAKDGLVSAWSAPRCVAVPLGARALQATTPGWKLSRKSAFFEGSARRAARGGARLRALHVTAKRLALVVTKCSRCGAVQVLVDGKRYRTVTTRSARTVHHAVIYLPPFSSERTVNVTLRTTSARPVTIEGLGALRRARR